MTRAGALMMTRMGSADLTYKGLPDDPGGLPSVVVAAAGPSIIEGGGADFDVSRLTPYPSTVSVDWNAASEGGSADLTGPVAGTEVFLPDETVPHRVTIRTVARDGAQGDRDVSLAISNPVGCEIPVDRSVAYISMRDNVDPVGDPFLPPPDRIVDVTGTSMLKTELAAASTGPGTQLRLRSGDYPDDYVLDKNGTNGHPISIYVPAGNTCNLRGTFQLNGAYNAVSGMAATGNQQKFTIRGAYARITRVSFVNIFYDGMIYNKNNNTPFARVDYCLFKDITGAAWRGELTESLKNQFMKFDHNHVWGHTAVPPPVPGGKPGNEAVIQILTDAFDPAFMEISDNLFEDAMRGLAGQQEIISGKTGSLRILRNTFIAMAKAEISFRVTCKSWAKENWMEGNVAIRTHGDDNVIEDNYAQQDVVRVSAGDCYNDTPAPLVCTSPPDTLLGRAPVIASGDPKDPCKGGMASCRRTIINRNVGNIIIGDRWNAGDPQVRDTTLNGNQKAAHVVPGSHAGSYVEGPPVPGLVTIAKKLTRADVGISAGIPAATLPNRSGRTVGHGVSYWYRDVPQYAAEEADTALLDAVTGSSHGTVADNTKFIMNLDGVYGGPVGGAMDIVNSVFNWDPGVLYGIGDAVAAIPKGGVYATDGSAWVNFVTPIVPRDHSTQIESNFAYWDDMTAGVYDARLQKYGERCVRRAALSNFPLKRLVLDFNHEMNDTSNDYKVWPSTRAKYKAAMTRAITQIRAGAEAFQAGAGAAIKFLHRPMITWIGPFQDWIPDGIDILSISFHPKAATVLNNADLTVLFNGVPGTTYGFKTDLLNAANALDTKIAFSEWSPKFEIGPPLQACPIADTVVQRFRDEILTMSPRVLYDCVYRENIRDLNAYEDTGDAAGVAAWKRMVPLRKSLWSGVKSP